MQLADQANQYIDARAPWQLSKTDPELAGQVCTSGLNALRMIIGLLKPVMPVLAQGVETFLAIESLTWDNLTYIITDHAILPYEHLAKRLDSDEVKKLFF